VKFDGYRALAYVAAASAARVAQRQGPDAALRDGREGDREGVEEPERVVDGEVCRSTPTGRASFSELQQGAGPLVYYAFDLLELDGQPLVDLPLSSGASASRAARQRATTVALLGGVRRRRRAARGGEAQGSRGSWPSALDSTYKQGKRTRDWLKVKTENNEEFVVTGYTRGGGRRGRHLRRARARGQRRR
jgi:bifunctional non-homologous end joining protein LigD